MSSTSTTRLGLFKPTPGSAEPFRTSDLNSNSDKIDAEAVAVDSRLDAVEAVGWVTATRLASTLDLTGKTVSVAAPSVDAHASTKKYVDDSVGAVAGGAWVSYSPTLGGGLAGGFSVNNAFYGRSGKTVFVRGVLSCSGASGSGLTLTLPVAAKADVVVFDGSAIKAGGIFPLFASVSTSGGVSTATFHVLNTGSAYGSRTALSTSVPASWTVDDSISFAVIYEGV
jgi:hypothetical protein